MRLVTANTCKAVYEMLYQVPPFCKWNLPPSDDIEFVVMHDPSCYGMYEPEHIITISSAKHGHLDTIIRTMAHEMIHLYQFTRNRGGWNIHGAVFNRYAHKVSESLGFDPKEL